MNTFKFVGKLKAIKDYVTPDMFSGANDAEKVQAAIDYSIENNNRGEKNVL